MSYRVTNSMMQALLLNDMHGNLGNLLKVQQQMSTQRKYNAASDNPNAVTKGMGLETMIFEGGQYRSNLQDANSWLKFTDDALGHIDNTFQRIRELAIYGGDGGLEGIDLHAIGEELTQLKEQMRGFANSTIGGEYLFSGLKTCRIPFGIGEGGEVVYGGNEHKLLWEFSRNQTGRVSLSGRDVFPKDEVTHSLKGSEVPLDFEWKGRGEILEFKVGWRTVKVRIPERWEDEIRDGMHDPTDYNRFRDPGEKLEGHTLDEIAQRINNSKEMGDVSKLLTASVVKDYDKGVQYLKIQSHTGEPVRLTGWPETDVVPRAEGIKGAAYGPLGRTVTGQGRFELRFDDNTVYTVDLAAGETLKDVAAKLNNIPDGRIWAAYKTNQADTTEWIDIVSRRPEDSFRMEAHGGAVALFAPERAIAKSHRHEGLEKLSGLAFDGGMPFAALTEGKLTLTQGKNKYVIDVNAADNLGVIAGKINALAGAPFAAAVNALGALEITSAGGRFEVNAEGGAVPLFSDGVTALSHAQKDSAGKFIMETEKLPTDFGLAAPPGALVFEYEGVKRWIDTAGCTDLKSVKDLLNATLGGIVPGFAASVKNGLDEFDKPSQWLVIETTGGKFKLSGFGDAADVIGMHAVGTKPIEMNKDHTHIGLAAMMGMETSLKSKEFTPDANLGDTTAAPLHMKIVSGKRNADIVINDNANLTMEELAKRINSICGEWLQAVVETDEPDGVNPFADPLNNSEQNKEDATQRLVLRTIDGEPFSVYDGPGKDPAIPAGDYTRRLGLNTALMGSSAGPVVYPDAAAGSSFDPNMPALLDVQVGERHFQVKVCRNKCETAEKVAAAIVRQVNEQYGETLLAWDANDPPNAANPHTFALYAMSGEVLRITDKGYGDPRYSEYTGGVAAQLGVAAGITTTVAKKYNDAVAANGLMRISTQGRTIDVPVLAGENLHQIANRIRDYAGSWLDVSFTNDTIDDPNGNVGMSLAAKDGSAVSVFDIDGDTASDFGFDTGLVGTVNLMGWIPVAGDTFTFSVNGAEHTIDLWDDTVPAGRPVLHSVEDLAEMINTRFQGMDIRAEVLETKNAAGVVIRKRLALWSPKGYTFSVSGTGTLPGAVGFAPGNTASANHGGVGPFNQVTTARTGNNRKETDFFGVIDNLIATVKGGDVDGISDVMLGKLDRWMGTMLKGRAQVGALLNRYTAMDERLVSSDTGYKELHTNTVGVDLAEVIMQYEMASSVYEASLAAIARIMQPTLLDFLR